MAIRGFVDGMEGHYVVGWAVAEPDTGNCAITLLDEAGELVAKGRASRHRADLASLGLGRTTLAFRILLPAREGLTRLRVLANDEELPGSPLLLGPGRFDGHCTIEGGRVNGWITERVRDFSPPRLTVYDQFGSEVARGGADFEAASIDPHFKPARFSLELDDQCFGQGERLLSVFVNDVAFARHSCLYTLRGNLETVSAEGCSGWLICPEVPSRGFEVEIFRDGVRVGQAPCEHVREDVRAVFPDCGAVGFGTALEKPTHAITEAVTLSLRLRGSNAELFDGPYVVSSRPAAVAAAYRAAQLAFCGLPGIGQAERAVLQIAMAQYLAAARAEQGLTATKLSNPDYAPRPGLRLAIIIPIYKGVEVTRACIESVLAHRDAETDMLVLINDCSPDAGMAGMLAPYAARPNLFLFTNEQNLGFVRTVNRGMAFAGGADILLLNSDTVMHAGGFEELIKVAYSRAEIGSVTAISNNATVFSYPNATLRKEALDDISWAELAAEALAHNGGSFVDVPTGHGFCMFIKGEVVRRIGYLDEGFGRGYGEENDFCARSAALGYRHVAAGGVLVVHRESISFENERASLLAQNLPRLNALYPEYTPLIMEFERLDGLRALRWALDRVRLGRAIAAGARFTLVISNALEGGTARALRDIERAVGYDGATPLVLSVNNNRVIELACEAPLIAASFLQSEAEELFAVLEAAAPAQVLVHQMLGFDKDFIAAFTDWIRERHAVFFAHDFYALCPRVTMIDAVGRFCDVADADTCARCVAMEGAHETSVLTDLTPAAHRALFADLFDAMTHVLTPSANAAGYLRRVFPDRRIEAVPHPENAEGVAAGARAGNDEEIVMLGAIGPHKGSHRLLEIARRARITHPHLSFRIIGYTDIDKALKAIGNVTITGKFKPDELAKLLAEARGRLALFLSSWPETYSYTLSEVVKYGFIPLLPDIGAPAERVRAVRYGVVFPFPGDPATILQLIDDIAAGRVAPYETGASPRDFFPDAGAIDRLRALINVPAAPAPREDGPRRRARPVRA